MSVSAIDLHACKFDKDLAYNVGIIGNGGLLCQGDAIAVNFLTAGSFGVGHDRFCGVG